MSGREANPTTGRAGAGLNSVGRVDLYLRGGVVEKQPPLLWVRLLWPQHKVAFVPLLHVLALLVHPPRLCAILLNLRAAWHSRTGPSWGRETAHPLFELFRPPLPCLNPTPHPLSLPQCSTPSLVVSRTVDRRARPECPQRGAAAGLQLSSSRASLPACWSLGASLPGTRDCALVAEQLWITVSYKAIFGAARTRGSTHDGLQCA